MESIQLDSKSSPQTNNGGQIRNLENHKIKQRLGKQVAFGDGFLFAATAQGVALSLVVAVLLVFGLAIDKVSAIDTQQQATNSGIKNYHQQQHDEQQQRALEADLNSIVQQHDAAFGAGNNDKWLAEAIISRLMVDNLTGSSLLNNNNGEQLEGADLLTGGEAVPVTGEALFSGESVGGAEQQQQQQQSSGQVYPSGPEAMRLRKLLSMLQNYEASITSNNGGAGQNFAAFPLLPNSQAATMKRAVMRMGAYLQPAARASQANGYGRDSFNFGLGKRGPDGSLSLVSSGNILQRFGDSLGGAGGGLQPVSQLGKRPSAHRFDFGLGKRVASPAYPTRYDFGLGKRAPNRIRYDFGLGK